jgi:hypothetical protein
MDLAVNYSSIELLSGACQRIDSSLSLDDLVDVLVDTQDHT